MLKYPCLVLDHDDTVVQSEAMVNYPFFCRILGDFRPGQSLTLREYTQGCFSDGFTGMCRRRFQFTDRELAEEYRAWHAYASDHMAPAYDGIEAVIRRQKAEGGRVCVVSHSGEKNIRRDYQAHFGISPDAVYSWDLPPEQRKPNPYPLLDIMHRFDLAPGELLMVDDLLPGWTMAQKAGVPMAFAAWSHQDLPEILREMEAVCDFSFSSPGELEHFLFD